MQNNSKMSNQLNIDDNKEEKVINQISISPNNKPKKPEYINTITTSHRKFIANINQNDSSGVSALLKHYINETQSNNKRNNKNEKDNVPIIALSKENYNKNKYSKLLNYKESNNINNINEKNNNTIYTKYNDIYANPKGRIDRTKSAGKIENKKIKEIERNIINMEKERNAYIEQYEKLPEFPKTKKELNDKRKLKKLIDELATNINIYTNNENNFLSKC